jgi:hypothetical protein
MWKFDAVRNVQCGYEGMYASEYYTGYRGNHDRIQQIGTTKQTLAALVFPPHQKLRIREQSCGDELPLFDALGPGRGRVCVRCHGMCLVHITGMAVCVCRNGVAVLDTLARLMPALSDTHFTALLRGIRRSSHMTCRLVPFLRGVATPKQRATESKKPLFGTSCEVIAMLCRSC